MRALDAEGQVTIDGERWKARSATPAPVGAKVVIERSTASRWRSGRPDRSGAGVTPRRGGPAAQRLQHDAVALGQLEQLVALLLRSRR